MLVLKSIIRINQKNRILVSDSLSRSNEKENWEKPEKFRETKIGHLIKQVQKLLKESEVGEGRRRQQCKLENEKNSTAVVHNHN